MIDVDYVVWDFDGVVNANMIDGRFIWADNFANDIGESLEIFNNSIFNAEFTRVIRGEKDLRDHISDWASTVGFTGAPEIIMDYWFRSDDRVDPRMVEIMDRVAGAGAGNAIATNNEARRASYIENEMGFGDRVGRVFSSGRMKCAKPDPAFFEQVSGSLKAAPDRLILIDDSLSNVRSAAALGWRTHYFTNFDYRALEARLGLG